MILYWLMKGNTPATGGMAVLSTSWRQRPSSLKAAHQNEWKGSALPFLAPGAFQHSGSGIGPQFESLKRLRNCESCADDPTTGSHRSEKNWQQTGSVSSPHSCAMNSGSCAESLRYTSFACMDSCLRQTKQNCHWWDCDARGISTSMSALGTTVGQHFKVRLQPVRPLSSPGQPLQQHILRGLHEHVSGQQASTRQ